MALNVGELYATIRLENRGFNRGLRNARDALVGFAGVAASVGRSIGGALFRALGPIAASGLAISGAAMLAFKAQALAVAASAAAAFYAVPLAVTGLGAKIILETKKGEKALKDFKKNIKQIMAEAAEPMREPVMQAMKDIQQTFEDVKPKLKEVFAAAAPGIEKLTQGFDKFMKNIMPGLIQLMEKSEPVFARVGELMGQIGTKLSDFFMYASEHGGDFTAFIDDVKQRLEPLWENIKMIVDIMRDEFGPVWEEAGKTSKTVNQALKESGPLLRLMAKIVAGILVVALRLLRGLLQDGIIPALKKTNEFIDAAIGWWNDLDQSIKDFDKDTRAAGKRWREGFVNYLGDVVDNISNLDSEFVKATSDLDGTLADIAKRAWGAFREWCRRKIDENIREIELIPDMIDGALKSLRPTMKDLGIDAIYGLWEGIRGQGGWLWRKMKAFVKDYVPGPVKEFLGISSPSRLFQEMGKEIPAGLVLGIQGGAKAVDQAMRNMVAPPRLPAYSRMALGGAGAVGAGGFGGGFGGSGPLVHIENWNAENGAGPDEQARALAWAAKGRG